MALGELMEVLLPYVGRICGPIALQDGPDAAQEAMIKILRGIRGLQNPDALFGWARVIAVREAVRIARAPGGCCRAVSVRCVPRVSPMPRGTGWNCARSACSVSGLGSTWCCGPAGA